MMEAAKSLAEIGCHLPLLDDYQQMIDNMPIEKLSAVEKIGQNLQQTAAAKIGELLRNHFVTIDEFYPDDFGLNEANVKQFAQHIRNIRMRGLYFREKKLAELVQSTFNNLQVIEFKSGKEIGHRMRPLFKNIDTIIFDTMKSDGKFCYYNDCLRYCEKLRCLKYYSVECSADEHEKFNAILSQKYIHLEVVRFDFQLRPNLENWTRFMQRNYSIKSIAIRFFNTDEQTILNIIKPVIDNAINLRKFYLLLHFDGKYEKPFDFGSIHEQLMSLDQRDNFDHLGIDFGNKMINNFDRISSLRSLKSLVVNRPDLCNILQEISRQAKGIKKLHLESYMDLMSPMENQRSLETGWNDTFPNLKELHLFQVQTAYLFVTLFIVRSPMLKRIFAHNCRVVFDKNVAMCLKKFNDLRAVREGAEPLIIYTNQKNVASNYEFSLVKLKQVECKEIDFYERNPFQSLVDRGVGVNFFRGGQKLEDAKKYDLFEPFD